MNKLKLEVEIKFTNNKHEEWIISVISSFLSSIQKGFEANHKKNKITWNIKGVDNN